LNEEIKLEKHYEFQTKPVSEYKHDLLTVMDLLTMKKLRLFGNDLTSSKYNLYKDLVTKYKEDNNFKRY